MQDLVRSPGIEPGTARANPEGRMFLRMDLLDSKQSEADHMPSDVCGGQKAMTIGIVLGE